MTKKILSVLLAALMAMSVLSITAGAFENMPSDTEYLLSTDVYYEIDSMTFALTNEQIADACDGEAVIYLPPCAAGKEIKLMTYSEKLFLIDGDFVEYTGLLDETVTFNCDCAFVYIHSAGNDAKPELRNSVITFTVSPDAEYDTANRAYSNEYAKYYYVEDADTGYRHYLTEAELDEMFNEKYLYLDDDNLGSNINLYARAEEDCYADGVSYDSMSIATIGNYNDDIGNICIITDSALSKIDILIVKLFMKFMTKFMGMYIKYINILNNAFYG